ncbi:MAG TPA: hypothetical protein VLM75_15160 [Spirochaetota bacterium]|nr:hypothetical protein [Spirochaetota bacterium]
MKTYLVPFVCLVLGFSGCLASSPAPIKETLLIEKSAEQEKNLTRIENEIVVINQENNKVKESLKITAQKVVISEKELSGLEKEATLLTEKKKLHVISDDTRALGEVEKAMVDNQQKINIEKLKLAYLKAKKDYEEADVELKESELSVKIAELNYEKARIARAFQDRTMGEIPADPKTGKKDEKSRIDVSVYEKYHASMKERAANNRQKYLKYADTFKMAEARLAESGYGK